MDSKTTVTHIEKAEMKRVLGVRDLFAVGYGDLGSSIYYALGITALYALGATPIALLFAGLVFACTALTYSELSSMLSESGGSATYSRHAFNDLISFIAGWSLLLDFIVTISISSFAVAPYLSYFFKALQEPLYIVLFTSFLILSLLLLNIMGTKHSTRLSIWLTGMTLATQIVIIIIGVVWAGNIGETIKHMRIGAGTAFSPTWQGFLRGCAMAMVAYTGIESMSQLSGEAKRPAKTVPRAILLAMGTLIFVYIGISIVSLSLITPQELSTTYLEDPIAGIVGAFPFGGKILGPWVGLLAAVILIVAANAGLMGSSRLAFKMGEYYQLPRFFYRLHGRYRTPFVSLTFFAILSIVIIIASRGKLSFLADLYNFGAMLAFCAAHLSLLWLRVKKPNLERPFKVPGNIRIRGKQLPITSLIGALVTFGVWTLVIITKPEGRYLGFAWVSVGLLLYFFNRKKSRIAPTAQLKIDRVKVPEFHSARYKHILIPTRGSERTQALQLACEMAKIHGAKVTAIHVIEVPFSMPLETRMYQRRRAAERTLKRAEAIGREFGITMHLEVIQARSVSKALNEIIAKEEVDLLILGSSTATHHYGSGLGVTCEQVIKSVPCPVLVSSIPD